MTSANEFIEQQLDERLNRLVQVLDADLLGFTGPLYRGVDDLLRLSIEDLVARPTRRHRLAIVLTTFGGYIEVVQRMVDTVRQHYPYCHLSDSKLRVLRRDGIRHVGR
jgi:hypothetical protein